MQAESIRCGWLGNIDVAREQALVDVHDNIEFQFPVYKRNTEDYLAHLNQYFS